MSANPHLYVGDCHLAGDPSNVHVVQRTGYLRDVFHDDDLRVHELRCGCGQRYLYVWRRVPRDSFRFWLPVSREEVEEVADRIASSPRTYTDKWIAAEAALKTLFQDRAFIVEDRLRHAGRPYWDSSGVPLAFTVSPF